MMAAAARFGVVEGVASPPSRDAAAREGGGAEGGCEDDAIARGNRAFRRGDLREAIRLYTVALADAPVGSAPDARALNNRSTAYANLGEWVSSLADARRVIAEADARSVKARYREGAALAALGRDEEAASAFAQGLSLDPSSKRMASALESARARVRDAFRDGRIQAGCVQHAEEALSDRLARRAEAEDLGREREERARREREAHARRMEQRRDEHARAMAESARRMRDGCGGGVGGGDQEAQKGSSWWWDVLSPGWEKEGGCGGGGDVDDIRAVRRAYRREASRWHPDKWVGGSASEKSRAEERFRAVQTAYDAALRALDS